MRNAALLTPKVPPLIKLILVSGKQGAGKTTFTAALAELFRQTSYVVRTFKFADPLYALHDIVNNEMADYGFDTLPKDGELLQLLGTDWARERFGPDVWAKIAQKYWGTLTDYYNSHKRPNSNGLIGIIEDCRFPNELDAFPDAFRIRLNCNEETRRARCTYWRENTAHISETALDDMNHKFNLNISTCVYDVESCVETFTKFFADFCIEGAEATKEGTHAKES